MDTEQSHKNQKGARDPVWGVMKGFWKTDLENEQSEPNDRCQEGVQEGEFLH
jgi:hypothetical protein